MPTISLLFCDGCGSEKVDVARVKGSNPRQFTIRCYACNTEAVIKGFTLGRADAPEPTLREAFGGRAGQQTMKLPRLQA
jgi:hypothetical protein